MSLLRCPSGHVDFAARRADKHEIPKQIPRNHHPKLNAKEIA